MGGIQTLLPNPSLHDLGMEKDFHNWNNLKTKIQSQQGSVIFDQRDIWWCSIGINVGHEADGKGPHYSRPVLVVRKFNKQIFLGVPLTTQTKDNPYYHQIHFKGREQCVMLSQMRLWESKRLKSRMGQLPENQFEEVRNALATMVLK